MKPSDTPAARGFTLIETVIAIGVLAVLLTGFMVVFAPAAAGIHDAISVQDADRLTATLEQELVTWRTGDPGTTGFDKAFDRIRNSNTENSALLVYKYRGDITKTRSDGSPSPVADPTNKIAGKNYIVQTTIRRKGDANFTDDLPAIEGGVYLVKCTPLVFNNGALTLGTPGTIKDLKGTTVYTSPTVPTTYPEAVIPFAAAFYKVPAKAAGYFTGTSAGFSTFFTKAMGNTSKPLFTRNLAVRR